MSRRDEYVPSISISNTAPPRRCDRCGNEIAGVFYVRDTTILCAKCRP